MSVHSARVVGSDSRHPSKLDWSTLEQAMRLSGNDNDSRCTRFQRVILGRLFDIPRENADDHITDGGDDCGIDCFVIDYSNNQIHLVSTKTIEAFEKAHKNFPGNEAVKLVSFAKDFVSRNELLPARCNPILRTKIREAWSHMDAGIFFNICIHVCSNQSDLVERDFKSLQDQLAEVRCSVYQHHLAELSEKITRNWKPPVSKTIRFLGQMIEHAGEIREDASSTRSLMGYIKISELINFLRDDETKLLDESLFHANVRGHLGVQNPVNKEISKSLSATESHKFYCLNNGITVICEKYFYQSGGFPVTVHRPQIVNGRQTAEAIFENYRREPGAVSNAVVTARIIETSDTAFIEEVSVATNNQSRIGTRDLRANSAIAKKLAAGLDAMGIYYARKRGDKSDRSSEMTIDALRAGQLILAYVRGKPEKAKTDTTSMFGESFEEVFNPNDVTAELIATAHKLFNDVEKLKRTAMVGMRASGLTATSNEHWLVEGSFHVLYVVALMARLRGLGLSNYDECSPLVTEAIAIVAGYYNGMNMAAYRLFRSVRARDELLELVTKGLPLPQINVPQLSFSFDAG